MKKAFYAHTSCIILSAGSSARMGMNKALLKFDEDNTFIRKITETYLLAGIDQIIVVVNTELYKLINENKPALPETVKLVINDKPELGRFYSLQTGINHVKTGNYCFFQNIDNPFTSVKLLQELIIFKAEADVIMPAFQGRTGHPVLISPLVVHKIFSEQDAGKRIDLFLKKLNVKLIETSDQNILVNINSQEDYLQLGASI